MNEIASGLRQLHGVHQEITRVRTELDRGPRQVRAKRRVLENKRTALAEQRERLTQSRKTADEKGLQLKANEAKLHDLQVKLNQATSNREFEAAKGQMDADRMANSVLEDEILEALDKVDSLQAAIAAGEEEAAELEESCQAFADRVAQTEEGLRKELERLEAELATAEEIIPPHLASDYHRLVRAHGATSLAPIDNKACSHCMTTVTAQQGIDLRTGKFTFCRNCGRLLYQVEG